MNHDPLTKDPSSSKTVIEKLLNVRSEEMSAVIGGILMFFFLFTGYAILRPVRDTMGIAGGIKNLQWLFLATFVAAIIFQLMFNALVSRVSRRTILPWVYAFFGANLVIFALFIQLSLAEVWVARVFYVWLSVFNLLAVSVAWSVLADIMPVNQSKRLFALAASGASAGGIIGPLMTTGLVTMVGHGGLMLISALLLIGAGGLGIYLHHWRDRHPPEDHSASIDDRKKPIGGNPFSGATAVFRSPYLMGIAVFVILLASTTTFLYFELMRIISVDFPDPERQTQVLSLIDLIVNASTIGIQVFLTGRIAQKLGVGPLLLIVPIVIAFGFLALAFMPFFGLVAFVMIVRRVGQYALVRPGREMLYTVMSPEEKYQAKNFIDTVLYRGGDALSALFKSLLDVIGKTPSLAMIVGAVIAGLWAFTGLGLIEAYKKRETNS